MLSNFGQALERLRQVNSENIKDMAYRLGIKSIELSYIENDKCVMSKDTFSTLVLLYDLASLKEYDFIALYKENQLITPTYYYNRGIRFNKERFMKDYKRNYERALEDGFTEEDLKTPYLDRLHKLTKSSRILKYISLAYTLGWLRGIVSTDEGYTKISCGGGIERIVQSQKSVPPHEKSQEV